MTRFIKLIRNVAFPVAIGVALSFGATQAVGQMSVLDSCIWDPPDRLGECETTQECDDLCTGTYGGFMGVCESGCCGCLFK